MNKILIFIICIVYIKIGSTYPITPSPSDDILEGCKINCMTAFGTTLGMSNNVTAFSNCGNDCINNDMVILKKEDTGFSDDVFTGMRWQCVEYARRWLIINKSVTFDSIDYAYQIYDLETVSNLDIPNENFKFISFNNGSEMPPAFGDLIIYPKTDDSPVGHVAVVVGVNIKSQYVDLAEQNYLNENWKTETFARRLFLSFCGNMHILTNKPWSSRLYFMNYSEIKCGLNFDNVLGWKRVQK